ncbi:hypothetical protein KP509_25G023600 [Ceratopteris richardii]|uniref:C2H2-type domain-containing protein n=1 Tax=Ceratopteris richardii TaxID=49495 RepID=A0A8T2RRE4_CERRI|nr:hypothetical protein KP509_25G023600 [Ceratopteris richardii]
MDPLISGFSSTTFSASRTRISSTRNEFEIIHLPDLTWKQQFQSAFSWKSPYRRSSLLSLATQRPIVVAGLFGTVSFEASKLRVDFLGDTKERRPDEHPRAYTLTHSDITSNLTLAVANNINHSQIEGWYSRFQRDEVLAEWRKIQGSMSLHVHCHVSGGHSLLDAIAGLRFYIFNKELPLVFKAFWHGDNELFTNHPELKEALVWVYFHSNLDKFNKAECWGTIKQAASLIGVERRCSVFLKDGGNHKRQPPSECADHCGCCFPKASIIRSHGNLNHKRKPHLSATDSSWWFPGILLYNM